MNDATIEVLSLLQAYNDTRVEVADTAFQSAVWNLTKARRAQRGALPSSCSTEMTASMVRWELRPRVGVVSSSREDDDTTAGVEQDQFQMVDVSKTKDPKQGNDTTISGDAQSEDTPHDVGLRQRKKGKALEESKEWTEESQEGASTESGDDPLVLLGGPLPPKELRTAHEKAVEAVEYYCKIASLVAAMQQRLNKASKQ